MWKKVIGGTVIVSPLGLSLLQAFAGYPHRAIAWLVIGGMTIQFAAEGNKVDQDKSWVLHTKS